MTLVQARAGAVRVAVENGTRLRLAASIGLPADVLVAEADAAIGCGACGAAARSGRPQWATLPVPGVAGGAPNADLAICRSHSGDWFGGECRRMLAMPLRHHGQLLGVYNLFHTGAEGDESPARVAMLEAAGGLLAAAVAQFHQASDMREAVVRQERQVIAADLHDSVGQQIAFAKMRLPLLGDAMRQAAAGGEPGPLVERYLEDVRQAIGHAHTALRVALSQLREPARPPGLAAALAEAADTFRARAGTELTLENRLPGLSLGAEAESQIFLVVQEALGNIARHAHARHAWVVLAPAGPAGIELSVEDDGVGLPQVAPTDRAAESGSHYGMQIMVERARRIGGTLTAGVRPGGGTRLCLALPLGPVAEGEPR